MIAERSRLRQLPARAGSSSAARPSRLSAFASPWRVRPSSPRRRACAARRAARARRRSIRRSNVRRAASSEHATARPPRAAAPSTCRTCRAPTAAARGRASRPAPAIDVLQFAHVARPGVPRRRGQRVRTEHARACGVACVTCRQNACASSGMSSSRSRSGGRRCGRRPAGTAGRRETGRRRPPPAAATLRRRDQPHVDRPRRVFADPPNLALLEHAQQLGLRARRQLADFVEKQRARRAPPRTARRAARPRP